LEALLVNVALTDALPDAWGLKVAVNDALLPAGIVTGGVIPVIENSDPLRPLIDDTVTAAVLALSVADWLWLVPFTILPKFMLAGLMVSWPATVVPVPDKDIVRDGLDAFEVIEILPLAVEADGGVNVTLNVLLWPAFKLSGTAIPLKVKPDPVAVTCEIVMPEPPELVNVSFCVELLPTTTFPKVMLAGLGDREPAVTPVPVSEIFSVEFDAVLVNAILPVTAPAACGEKVMLNEVLWPEFNVRGRLKPVRLKPDPVSVTLEIVRLEPPELFRVTDWLLLLPIETLAKLTLEGFAPRKPGVIAVPVRGIFKLELLALLTIATFPLAVPPDVGAKVTLKVALWPAVRVVGRVKPLELKPVPVTVACEIVTLDWPELFRVAVSVCWLPTCNGPKAKLDGFDVSEPAATPVPARGRLRVGVEALLVTLKVPNAFPVACGAKFTVNVALWPAVRASGKVGPLRLYPVPLTTALEIITLLEPVLVMVSDWFWLAPICTLPKLRPGSTADSWPDVLEEVMGWELLAAFTPTQPIITETNSRTIPQERIRRRDRRSITRWPRFVAVLATYGGGFGALGRTCTNDCRQAVPCGLILAIQEELRIDS
jgi:hypothetical protein